MIENTVNGFINMINGAIGIINAIPGVNISRINTLNIPKLYRGGVLEKDKLVYLKEMEQKRLFLLKEIKAG